jgi:PAS domain S-box-containing protein
VVEDESIVAQDFESGLKSMGYDVPLVAASGEEALRQAGEIRPDLALIDINLRGAMDGIETAARLREIFGVPPVYLAAYGDRETFDRARITEPFGYIVRPFDARDLYITIEMALYRRRTESRFKQSERWLAALLHATADAVIAVSTAGLVLFMSPAAEDLTGWRLEAALGEDITAILEIVNEGTRGRAANPLTEVLRRGGAAVPPSGFQLASRDGQEIPVDCRAVPIRDDRGALTAALVILRETLHSEAPRLDSQGRKPPERILVARQASAAPMSATIQFARKP